MLRGLRLDVGVASKLWLAYTKIRKNALRSECVLFNELTTAFVTDGVEFKAKRRLLREYRFAFFDGFKNRDVFDRG